MDSPGRETVLWSGAKSGDNRSGGVETGAEVPGGAKIREGVHDGARKNSANTEAGCAVVGRIFATYFCGVFPSIVFICKHSVVLFSFYL